MENGQPQPFRVLIVEQLTLVVQSNTCGIAGLAMDFRLRLICQVLFLFEYWCGCNMMVQSKRIVCVFDPYDEEGIMKGNQHLNYYKHT